MLGKRALTMGDYLAMLRRRIWWIVIPTLLAPLLGFLVSYAFAPKYKSQSLVLVEGQKVPEGYVKPVVTEDLMQRIATMQQQVLTRSRLRPMIERLDLAKNPADADELIASVRENLSIDPVQPSSVGSNATTTTSSGKKKKAGPSPSNSSDVPGFYVSFTANKPRIAQQICAALTSMLLEENLKAREQLAQGTTDFLTRQLDESKQTLDDLEGKITSFKKDHMGQLPGDEDSNLKILMTLNSQLEASTQTLNRATQDKSYAESGLAQQLANWKSSQTSINPQTLEQQISSLQSQLVTQQSRYTDDHPDVIKTKNDIAELKRKLDEVNAAPVQAIEATAAAANSEPAEIRQLRSQIHQYDTVIKQVTADQKRLETQISQYQSRVVLSPGIEEQYKGLTRDYDTAQRVYNDLLAKKTQAEIQTDMEHRQQGEQMRLLNPASLPDSPSFPTRWMFAAGGLGAGLGLGFGLAILKEFLDSSVRNERDVQAALELPMLGALPWIVAGAGGKGK
jgi:protein tyrosine kinase modulator